MYSQIIRGLTVVLVLFVAATVDAQDDVDPLAELAALGDAIAETGPEGGGSIRAKRDVDPEVAKRMKDPKNFEGKVEMVKLGRFPAVAIKIKVTKPAKDGAGKSIKRNASLVVIPKLKVDSGKVAMEDGSTLINAGAFYLKKGDKVLVRLGAEKGKVWEADYIERK